jgi:hypothetical protein
MVAHPLQSTTESASAGLPGEPHLCGCLSGAYPKQTGWHFAVRSLAAQQASQVRSWLTLSFGAVAFVLLIACINASGLLLLRALVRRREWAIRGSLGATPTRLFSQVFAETGLLVVAACIAGVVLAIGLVRVINEVGPLRSSVISLWTYAFAAAVTFASTMLATIMPVVVIVRLPLEQSLKGGDTRRRSKGWRAALPGKSPLPSRCFAADPSVDKLFDGRSGFQRPLRSAAIQLLNRGPDPAGVVAVLPNPHEPYCRSSRRRISVRGADPFQFKW